MNNKPRQVLCELITDHGTSLAEDRGRCSALLRDACGHFKSETNVLIVAMDEGIPAALVKDRNSGPVRLLAQRLTKRLQDDRHLTQEAAFWAVESWALALGFSAKDLKQPPPPPPDPNGGQNPPPQNPPNTGQKTPQSGTFIDSAKLTKWTQRLLYLNIAADVIAVISGISEYRLLSDFDSGIYSESGAEAASEANDARQAVIGVIQIVIFLVSGILMLKWIYRANFNARQLGAAGMQFTPGWSIGWYFIPVANLWKPYQAMQEIWKASANPQHWTNQPVTELLGWWWFFWIASNLLANLSLQIKTKADGIDELIDANIVTLLSDTTHIVLSLIVLAIVKKVYAMQASRYLNIP